MSISIHSEMETELRQNVYLKHYKLHVFEEKFAISHDAQYKYACCKSRDNIILLLSNLYVVFFYTEQAMFKNNCYKCSFVLLEKLLYFFIVLHTTV